MNDDFGGRSSGSCNELVGLNDLMATFAELAGANPAGPDSVSFANLLRDPQAEGRRKSLVMQSVGPFVVRDGDWKLCLCPGSGTNDNYGNKPRSEEAWKSAMKVFGKTPTWKDLAQYPFVQLYNLTEDPHEDHNLAAKHPERVAEMVALLRKQTQGSININQRVPNFIKKQLK